MSGTTILGLVGAAVIVVLLFEMLRRQRLREKHAVIWFVVALSIVVIGLFPQVLIRASQFVGVQVPSNLLFFLASLVLLALSVQFSYEIGRLEGHTRTLAEEIALLRLRLDELDPQGGASRAAESGDDAACADPAD